MTCVYGVGVYDFNEVLHKEEHEGVNERCTTQVAAFRETVDVYELSDLGYTGLPWTFKKRVVGGSYRRTRLDSALASASWCMRYLMAIVKHLIASTSDHSPILLELSSREWIPSHNNCPFRYEVMWDTHEEFDPSLKKFLQEGGICSNMEEVKNKLHQTSTGLKRWNLHTFGSVRKQLKELWSKLEDMREDPGRLGPSHVEIKVCDKLVEIQQIEEMLWRQRSLAGWLKVRKILTFPSKGQAKGRRKIKYPNYRGPMV
jgi:hypothetical protein